eukprot:1147203-Pelagomonas_calceolata.AAC.5
MRPTTKAHGWKGNYKGLQEAHSLRVNKSPLGADLASMDIGSADHLALQIKLDTQGDLQLDCSADQPVAGPRQPTNPKARTQKRKALLLCCKIYRFGEGTGSLNVGLIGLVL